MTAEASERGLRFKTQRVVVQLGAFLRLYHWYSYRGGTKNITRWHGAFAASGSGLNSRRRCCVIQAAAEDGAVDHVESGEQWRWHSETVKCAAPKRH